MERVNRCVACGSRVLVRYRARVAPFLAARVEELSRHEAELVRCRDCGLGFFEPRLDDTELAAVYKGYRGEAYQRERQRHEPTYTPELNALLGQGTAEVASRNANLRNTLERHLPLSTIGSVLDYGGDHGQFIPPEIGAARRVVYEVSGVEAWNGAVAVSNWEVAARERFDLVLCNHVLEHLACPATVAEKLLQVANPEGWLYFEVPADSPFQSMTSKSWKRRTFSAGLQIPAIANLYFRIVGRTPLEMHEHVNLFGVDSLRALLERSGLEVVEIGERELDCGWTMARVVSALARPPRGGAGSAPQSGTAYRTVSKPWKAWLRR
jgi:SAM-dependent methyltransferase